jgi:DNA-binding transcriptional LysR family regulator
MPHPWDEDVRGTQVPIVINPDAATVRCVAGPGSGKTFGLVRRVEGGRQALADLDGLTHGSLLIGASTTPGLYVLPRIVAAFRTKYPGVDVKLQIANSQSIEGRVREHDLDLGIVGGHALRPGEECLTAGMRDELALIVAPAHAWSRRRDVTPESLADEPLLVREEGSRPVASQNARYNVSSSAWRWSSTTPKR